jgi:hypothetical protein
MGRFGDSQYDDVDESAVPENLSFLVKDTSGSGTATKEITLDVLAVILGGLSVATTWGTITGTLSSQTDLNSALAGKQTLDVTLTALAALDSSAGILEQTGADTFTKRALGVGASTSVPTRADADARYALVGASAVPAFANVTNTVYAIADGPSVDINPANGGIQTWTLGANRTPTAASFAAGQAVTLMINDGTAFTVTWSTIGVVWVGGSAPTLPTSGYAVIELWKVGSTVYGASVGDVA